MKYRICRIRLAAAGVGVGLGAASFAPLANAQNPKPVAFPETPLLQGIVRGEGDEAFLVQNPELILGADVRSVLLSPDSRFLLATRSIRAATVSSLLSPTGDVDAPGEISISLWRSRTHRSTVLWRRPLEPGQSATLLLSGWMGSTGTALAMVGINPSRDADTTWLMLFLDTASGTVRETAVPPKTMWIPKVSPTQALAALTGVWGDNKIRFLRSDGTLTDVLPLPGQVYFTRWSEDGKTLRGFSQPKGAQPSDEPNWYAVDPGARTVSRIAAPLKYKDEGDPEPGDLGQANLPLSLAARPTDDKSHTEIWLEARDNGKASVRLARKGEPVGIFHDLSGAVYRTESGLYFVPLLTVAKDQLPPTKTVQEAQSK